MSKVFGRKKLLTKAVCAISAAAIVTGGIAFYLSKDTRVLASAVEEGKTVPANLDAVSAINYATILGRATDFGIVANDFEQVTHMETTFAVNTFSNTSGQVNEVDFIGNTAQFMVAEVTSGKIKFGQNQTASSYVIESTNEVFNNFNSEWNSGEIFQDDDGANSSNFYFDNAGRLWTGDNATPVYTIIKDRDDITTNVNDVIGNATASSNYISSRANDPSYALDYTQYLTIDNINRNPYNPQDPNTGNPDQGNRFYIDIDKSEFVNRVVYINVDANLARVMSNSEGLCIIKHPSTVVVFNIEDGITSGQNGGLVLDRMCVSEDGGRNFCNTVTASQGSTEAHSTSNGLGTVNNIKFNNDDVDRMINQKVILNIRSSSSNIELNAVGGTVLIPNPNATANVRGSSSGWVVSAGHLRNEGGEWHYIYQGGSQDLINISNGQQIHFAMHKDFTSDNGLTSDNSIYMEPDQFTFNLYDLGTNRDFSSINLDSVNGLTPVTASNQATGNVFFPNFTLNQAGDYYYLINEQHAGSNDGQITNSDGYIKIHVHVEQASPANRYTVDYAYYLHANDTTPLRQETNVAMMGVQFDLGKFFNLVETTGTLTLNKTVLGVSADDALETYTFYVTDGTYYYGMSRTGELQQGRSPIACEVHPGVPFVLRGLPLDRIYSVTESRTGIDITHYDCTVSGEGSVTLSTNGTHNGSINITNTYVGKFEMGALHIAKFGSDTNGALLGGATFSLTTSAATNNVTVTGASNVQISNGTVNFTTVNTNDVFVEGLQEGSYTLTEVTAPENYETAEPVEFRVDGFGQIVYNGTASNVSYNATSNVMSITDNYVEPVPVTATVGISKKDTVAGNELPGASITITSNNGNDLTNCVVTGGSGDATISGSTISFTSADTPTVIEGLPVGTYTMHEVTAPDGYQTTTNIEFTVGEDGTVTGSQVTAATASNNAVVTMYDAPTEVDISKVSLGAGQELPGAELHIYSVDDNVDLSHVTVSGAQRASVTSSRVVFISGQHAATITGLPNGRYVLHEEVAPNVDGVQYVVATDIGFEISNGQVISGENVTVATSTSNAVVTMVDDVFVAPTGTVDISKIDTVGGRELPNAVITITSDDGLSLTDCVISGGAQAPSINNSVITYTTGINPTTISGLPAGDYTMREVAAPTGYAVATEISFTVGTDGTVTGSRVTAATTTSNAVVTMEDAPIVVDFSKQDLVSHEELSGAEITITGPANADLAACTVSGGGNVIEQTSDVIRYISGDTPTTISGLPFGTYTMTEVTPPTGYQTTTAINFTIAQNGTVTGGNVTAATDNHNAVVTMFDGPSVVDISKVATGATSELPGAEIWITSADANSNTDLMVASVSGGAQDVHITSSRISFTSGNSPATITGLPDGTYIMHEETAPTGYVAATDIRFTIEDGVVQRGTSITTASGSTNARVTMEDAVEVTEITGTVDISKKDIVTGDELSGAEITITSTAGDNLENCVVTGGGSVIEQSGNVIRYISGDQPTTISGLPAGAYQMNEVTAPTGYQTATYIEFVVEADGSITGSRVTEATATNNAVVTMLDAPIVADFSKIDTVAGTELAGAEITITGPASADLSNCVVSGGGAVLEQTSNTIRYISGDTPTTIMYLPTGTYSMVENAAPAGYSVSTTVNFTIGQNGAVTGSAVVPATDSSNAVVTMSDMPSVVDIDKVAAGAGTELPGAELQITCNDANVSLLGARVTGGAQTPRVTDSAITFTSGDSPATIYALPDGTYTLTETRAPNIGGVQYAVATSIQFSIVDGVVQAGENITVATNNSHAVVTMVDDIEVPAGATVDISKVEAGGIAELPGAELLITHADSTVDLRVATVTGGAQSAEVTASAITITSGTSPATISGLPDGTYTLHETTAPVINGVQYNLATDIQFTVSNGVVLDGAHITAATTNTNARVTMEDTIHVDSTTPGATVEISKVDASSLEELEGAEIWITCADINTDLTVASVAGGAQDVSVTNTLISFRSGINPAVITDLPDGTYTMHEETAPNGYLTATDITFVVENGVVLDGTNITVATQDTNARVTMADAADSNTTTGTTISFSKQNLAGEELPGAELVLTGPSSLENVIVTGGGTVTSQSGNTIEFTSGNANTIFEGLPDGDYTLVENVAPNVNGVQYVETTITFTIDNGNVTTTSTDARVITTGNVPVVVMYDDALATNTTTCTLTLNKDLVASGASAPASYTFNVKCGDVYYGIDDQGNVISDSDPIAITVVPGTPVELAGLPNGDYEVTEVRTGIDVPGYSVNVTGEETVTLDNANAATATAEVTITNTYTALPGSLTIVKDLADGAPASAASMSYSFTVTGPNGYSNVVSVTGEGSVVIDNLAPGTYVVTENTDAANIEGYTLTVSGSGATAEVTSGSNASVTVVNTYTENVVPSEPTESSVETVAPTESSAEVLPTVETTPAPVETTPAPVETTPAPTAAATVATTTTTTTTEATTTTTAGITSMDINISKQDIAGAEIDGAVLTITNADGNNVDFLAAGVTATQNGLPAEGLEVTADSLQFTTVSSSQALIHNLPVGHYVLTETIAPRGYLIAESISFEVRNDGTIWVAGTSEAEMVERIVMQDLADPSYGASVLGAARESAVETSAESAGGSAARTGETIISATAVVAVVLFLAGGAVLILRKKINEIY